MYPDSSYHKWDNSEEVELTVQGESSAPGRGGKALCLSSSTQGKAIAILYVLLVICIAVVTALIVVNVGKLSQGPAEARLDRDTIRRDSRINLSDHQDYPEIRNLTHSMSKELAEVRRDHDRLQEVLSRVQDELRNITEVICTKCPPGWQHFEKKCYFISTSTKSWLDAKQFCTNEGSHLVIVNTKQEQMFLSNHITEPNVYWLGLSDSAKEGEWHWLDGSPLSVRFWGPREPNNVGHQGEDCGSLRFDGKWNDATCSMTEHWICERQC
ncbi:C-type lectin domain family 17, member A-like [Gopherus evgoodei]|uniref:C-type lectin domain family 17, member A-like n=1 Tax=Gopherus evgoodei TaxID=1825980 RepID=UPI0011D0235D|nr:C-type lectin domain family 17, member A-like [Gopherus evgoodei]